jgi:hypothetical protein
MSENNVVSLTGRVLIRNSSRKHSVLQKSGNGAQRPNWSSESVAIYWGRAAIQFAAASARSLSAHAAT